MPLDMLAIADAIAARYASGTLAPPAGLPAIRSATARAPSAITKTPILVVIPDQGEVTEIGGQQRAMTHDFLVRFYLAQTTDLARDYATLQKWLSVLLYAHQASIALGGLVTVVRTLGWRVGEMRHATANYEGIELKVQAVTTEPWTPS